MYVSLEVTISVKWEIYIQVFHGRFKGVPRSFQEGSKGDSNLFSGCFKQGSLFYHVRGRGNIGTSVRRSSRSAFGRLTCNNVSVH